MSKKKPPLPTRDDILKFILASPEPVTRRDIAHAFGLKGDDRILMKETLKALETAGEVRRNPGRAYAAPTALREPVQMVEILGLDPDGDLVARPLEWREPGKPPRIIMKPERKGQTHLTAGDHALARLRPIADGEYEGTLIRAMTEAPGRIVGVFQKSGRDGAIIPTDRSHKEEFHVPERWANGAQTGELVVAEIHPALRKGRSEARVTERLGDSNNPKNISLIAIHSRGIPTEFPPEALAEAEAMGIPGTNGREDLRAVPLVTIDGADARDFDDAVFAERDGKNDGHWHLIVAIADVSFYVRPGTALDREAFRRGNSSYFPDRVVPMLPEKLSNDLCSLRPHEPRACLAAHLWIDAQGRLVKHRFSRALMRSAARLTYEQVQAARDGVTDDVTAPLLEPVIGPLYEAFAILDKARQERGALELDLPEKKVQLDETGRIRSITSRQRLDSHKLIEEFMILANVAAAEALEAKNAACVYRIHDSPDPVKVEAVREFLSEMGYTLASGTVNRAAQINHLLKKAAGREEAPLINMVVLRSQSQAVYSPDNIGHFGLALQRYAHFTSPIRRYADLVVHRSLTQAYGFGEGGLARDEALRLHKTCEQISFTERRSMEAERDATDRYTALYLSTQGGAVFQGHISGATRFGLFVKLDETGADGLVPIRTLPNDFYIHDEHQHALIGRQSGRIYRLCAPVSVRLVEADPLTGSTIFEMLNTEGADVPGFAGISAPGSGRTQAGRQGRKGGKNFRGGKPGGKKYGGKNRGQKGRGGKRR